MAYPKITIAITCYNAEATIARALKSAFMQTYSDFEVIIVDDCSTDRSVSIVESILKDRAVGRLVKHENNKGYPNALNTLIEHATGDVIAFFDDDDDHQSDRLAKQIDRVVRYKQEHTNAKHVFCYTNRAVVRAGDTAPTPEAEVKAIGRMSPEPHGQDVADFILLNTGNTYMCWGMFGSGTLMIDRNTLIELGGFDENFRRCAEWDLAIRGAFEDAHFIAVNECLVTQYKTPTVDKAGFKPLIYRLMLCQKYKSYLKKRKSYWGALAAARASFYRSRGSSIKYVFYTLLSWGFAPEEIFWFKIKKYLTN